TRKPEEAERAGGGGAAAGEEEVPGPEERSGEEPAGCVVDAEGAIVPARRLAPGDSRGRDRVGAETCRPREKLPPSAPPVPAGKQAREPEGQQCRGERDERFHVPQPRSLRS